MFIWAIYHANIKPENHNTARLFLPHREKNRTTTKTEKLQDQNQPAPVAVAVVKNHSNTNQYEWNHGLLDEN